MTIELNRIYNEDCLEGMRRIPDKSVDMVLCDLPYGTTACKWDTIIPFRPLWAEYERVIKDSGAIVLTAAQPFTSALINSNPSLFKYALVWKKSKICHFAQAPYRFLTEHEDICVFSKGGCSKNARVRMSYNPQGLVDIEKVCRGKGHSDHRPSAKRQADYLQTKTGYPKSILDFKSVSNPQHPTEKPVDLFRYLIRTYTNPGETVLDNCMGSGTTAVAAALEGRNFIGFETDAGYVEIANQRLATLEEAKATAA